MPNNPEPQLTFGQWLRQRRRVLDLTQTELAAAVPCAGGTVRRLEADDLRPSKELAERLAHALGLSEEQRSAFVAFARTGFWSEGSAALPADDLPDGQRSRPASPIPHSARRYTIPAPATPLLGRLHAVNLAVELLRRPDVRLVTLLGAPGVGKTHLALQIGREMEEIFRDGGCFVPLAPVAQVEGVLPAIARSLELLDSGQALAPALAERLRREEMLLVLDNFEHLIGAAPFVAELLAAASGVKMLVTSRLPLRISGEHEFVVPPLALPEQKRDLPLATLSENPAVALFVARAKAAHASFAFTGESAEIVAEICRRLDGLPLAIELAAPRIKLLSLTGLLARLERRLPFLTGGRREAGARQATLEAAIGWSYDLLNAQEQRTLARLAIFRGGWTLEAAEAVCAEEAPLLDLLSSLVDHSLAHSVYGPDGGVRFSMLEVIREFGLLHLEEAEETEAMQARHGHYFLSLAVDAEAGLQGREQVAWMDRLKTDGDNLAAAFAWSLGPGGDSHLGLQAAAALWWFWWTNGQVGEGRHWLERLLESARSSQLADTSSYARALLAAGILAFFAGDLAAARPRFDNAYQLSAARGDSITHGYARFMQGTVLILSGDREKGYGFLEQADQLLAQAGPAALWHRGVTNLARTLLLLERDDLAAAQASAERGMAFLRQLEQPYGVGLAHNYLGDVARRKGDMAQAALCYRAALPLLEEARARSEIPAVLHNLAHALLAQGESSRARTLFAQGLALHQEIGNVMGTAECLIGLAAVALNEGRPQTAALLLGATDSLLESLHARLFAGEQALYEQIEQRGSEWMGAHPWQLAQQQGRAIGLEEVLISAE